MSDVTREPGWWIASDGKWYPPHLRERTDVRLVSPQGAEEPEGPDWWLASDGKWYPPAFREDMSEDEAALFRRYMGFVPDPGPEPEIRPELREPLRQPALVGVPSDDAQPDPSGAGLAFPQTRDSSGSAHDSDDDELDSSVVAEAPEVNPAPAQRRSRGPRHRRQARRRWRW